MDGGIVAFDCGLAGQANCSTLREVAGSLPCHCIGSLGWTQEKLVLRVVMLWSRAKNVGVGHAKRPRHVIGC
jgi:hypothetical protein